MVFEKHCHRVIARMVLVFVLCMSIGAFANDLSEGDAKAAVRKAEKSFAQVMKEVTKSDKAVVKAEKAMVAADKAIDELKGEIAGYEQKFKDAREGNQSVLSSKIETLKQKIQNTEAGKVEIAKTIEKIQNEAASVKMKALKAEEAVIDAKIKLQEILNRNPVTRALNDVKNAKANCAAGKAASKAQGRELKVARNDLRKANAELAAINRQVDDIEAEIKKLAEAQDKACVRTSDMRHSITDCQNLRMKLLAIKKQLEAKVEEKNALFNRAEKHLADANAAWQKAKESLEAAKKNVKAVKSGKTAVDSTQKSVENSAK